MVNIGVKPLLKVVVTHFEFSPIFTNRIQSPSSLGIILFILISTLCCFFNAKYSGTEPLPKSTQYLGHSMLLDAQIAS